MTVKTKARSFERALLLRTALIVAAPVAAIALLIPTHARVSSSRPVTLFRLAIARIRDGGADTARDGHSFLFLQQSVCGYGTQSDGCVAAPFGAVLGGGHER